jgi:hypothetical protein
VILVGSTEKASPRVIKGKRDVFRASLKSPKHKNPAPQGLETLEV